MFIEHLATDIIGIALLNMDKSLPQSKSNDKNIGKSIMSRKVIEPARFYTGLVLISGIIFLF